MNTKLIIERLDDLLIPIGFARKKDTWNRNSGCFIDVIDLQVDKTGYAMTLNTGVFCPRVHQICWGDVPPSFVTEPFCIVRARIGQLMHGRDLWWRLDSDTTIIEVLQAVNNCVLPYLNGTHSLAALEHVLISSQDDKQKYPLSVIYLAIIKQRRGDVSGACRILDDLKDNVTAAWHERISQVVETLACQHHHEF